MKYKVGDKVKVKSLEWYEDNLSNPDGVDFVFEMSKYCGSIGIITGVSLESDTYKIYINGDDTSWFWNDSMLEDVNQEGCEYCREKSRRALLSDEKYNESFVEVAGDKLVMVTDDAYSTKINYCPMCARKL